jgi:hypothetical protein
MKRWLAIAAMFLSVTFPSGLIAGTSDIQTRQEEKISLSTKVPVHLYGFVSAEGMYSDSQLSSFGTLNNDPANYNRTMPGFNRVVDESIDGNNDAFISGTIQNTRFGFSLEPYDFGGKKFTVAARLEMDFFSTTELSISSVRPRIRRAYACLGTGKGHILFGHEWEIFSPLNTSTLNIGGNLWQQGNLGFRRPQIALSYNFDVGQKSKIETTGSVNLPSNSMAFNDNGNTTGIPMLQGRLGFLHPLPDGEMKAYVSGVYARHKNAVAGAEQVNNWGIAASIEVPAHKLFVPSAEFHYGYSLGALLSISSDTSRQRTISGWGQVKSLWLDWFETNVGYGCETLKSSEVAAGFVRRNQMGFANVQFKPVPSFVIGLEYNYMRTNYQGTGASEANAFLSNILYFF